MEFIIRILEYLVVPPEAFMSALILSSMNFINFNQHSLLK